MRKVLCLAIFLAAPIHAEDIDQIVRQAIEQSKKTTRTPSCECSPGCNCDGCLCKPGYKCDNNGCQKLKGSEPNVQICWVVIDDSKFYTIKDMTATEANSRLKAQGSKVVFVDAGGTVVDPPSWYKGQVALSASQFKNSSRSQGVAGNLPFTTPGIIAQTPSVSPSSMWSSRTYQMAPTPIGAPSVGLYGGMGGSIGSFGAGFSFGSGMNGYAGCKTG